MYSHHRPCWPTSVFTAFWQPAWIAMYESPMAFHYDCPSLQPVSVNGATLSSVAASDMTSRQWWSLTSPFRIGTRDVSRAGFETWLACDMQFRANGDTLKGRVLGYGSSRLRHCPLSWSSPNALSSNIKLSCFAHFAWKFPDNKRQSRCSKHPRPYSLA